MLYSMSMKWVRQKTWRLNHHAWVVLCVRTVLIAALYIVHACFNAGDRNGCGSPAFGCGLESAPAGEGNRYFVCGEACFDTDAILPRASENDPFLIFLSLAATLPPPISLRLGIDIDHLRAVITDNPSYLYAPHPQLRILAHTSHVLC